MQRKNSIEDRLKSLRHTMNRMVSRVNKRISSTVASTQQFATDHPYVAAAGISALVLSAGAVGLVYAGGVVALKAATVSIPVLGKAFAALSMYSLPAQVALTAVSAGALAGMVSGLAFGLSKLVNAVKAKLSARNNAAASVDAPAPGSMSTIADGLKVELKVVADNANALAASPAANNAAAAATQQSQADELSKASEFSSAFDPAPAHQEPVDAATAPKAGNY